MIVHSAPAPFLFLHLDQSPENRHHFTPPIIPTPPAKLLLARNHIRRQARAIRQARVRQVLQNRRRVNQHQAAGIFYHVRNHQHGKIQASLGAQSIQGFSKRLQVFIQLQQVGHFGLGNGELQAAGLVEL